MGLPEPSVSHWWDICHDCAHRRSFTASWIQRPGAHPLDAALLLAALDLAEHQADSGHRRCVLWTGAAAAQRGPHPAEVAVCAKHPAYVVPQLGAALVRGSAARECALVPRALVVADGGGVSSVRGYPVAVPAWLDPQHADEPITAWSVPRDHTRVCLPCACVTDGSGAHGSAGTDAGSSSDH